MSGRTKPKSRRSSRAPGFSEYGRNPIRDAIMRRQITDWISKLETSGGLQAFLGANTPKLIADAGRVFFIAAESGRLCRLDQTTPDYRILGGAANAIAELAGGRGNEELHRAAIRSGLAAAHRIIEQCSVWAIGTASIKVEDLLDTPEGLTLFDITGQKEATP